jgi:hypothetical protein
MSEAAQISHPKVTNNTGKVERVVVSTIASTTRLQAGTTITMHTFRSGDGSTKAQDGFIGELNQLYEFKDGQVEGFIEENPSLADLLFEAYKIIPGHFGPETGMALEMVADPEALGDKQLFLLIRTELPRKVALERLSELDRAWWLDMVPEAEGRMEIALE